MEIKITAKTILAFLKVLSWIIFLGLCIEAGGLIFNTVYAMYKPLVAAHFWNDADLSDLYAFDRGHFLAQTILMIIVSLMKAVIFYLIIKLSYDKNFDFSKPFRPGLPRLIFNIAYLCLGAGIFSLWGSNTAKWLGTQGVSMPDIESLGLGGGDVWLFMAVILFVIGQVFKKGTELQTESDLTV